MIKFISWVISLSLAVGVGDAYVRLTYRMATSAKNAFQQEQLSYSKFNRALWAQPGRESR